MTETYEWKVRQCEQALLKAAQDCDVETMRALLHPDAKITDANGQLHNRESILSNYQSGQISVLMKTGMQQHISVVANYATVAGVMVMQGEYLGRDINDEFEYLRFWFVDETGCQLKAGSLIKR